MGGNPQGTGRPDPHREGIQSSGRPKSRRKPRSSPRRRRSRGRWKRKSCASRRIPACIGSKATRRNPQRPPNPASIPTRADRCSSKLSPIPMVCGKATLEIPGAHSLNIFTNPEQEFYIQLSQTERFGIIKLMPKGTVADRRGADDRAGHEGDGRGTVPMEVFQKQMTPDGLYKIWPKQPLPARRIRRGGVQRRQDEHADLGFRGEARSSRSV